MIDGIFMPTIEGFVELVKSRGFVRLPGFEGHQDTDAYHSGFDGNTEVAVLITIKSYPSHNGAFTVGYIAGSRMRKVELVGQFNRYGELNMDAKRILEILR